MPGQPPKLTQWSENVVAQSPGIFTVRPSVPSAWAFWCGAQGYWLPFALNQSKRYRRALRGLR